MRRRTAIHSAMIAAFVVLPAALATAQTLLQTSVDETRSTPPPTTPSLDCPAMLFQPEVGCGKACAFHAAVNNGWTPGQLLPGARFGPRGPGDPTNVINNNLAIEILSVTPPTSGTGSGSAAISGTNVMTVLCNQNGLTTFTFRLRSQYTITNCTVTDTVGPYTVTPTLPPANNSSYGRTITFLRPISAGQTFTISISYFGDSAYVGLGSFFAGTQNGAAGAPFSVCTLSEPYYAASWWPCKDGDVSQPGDNSDKATLDMAITASDTLTSVSNGLLVGVDALSGNRTRYRWSTGYPLTTYLAFFATSQFTQWTVNYNYTGGTMPVQFSIYPSSDTTNNRNVWQKVPTMLATYAPMYGLYPFINEKYGIYQFEFSGGQEHQTYTGQGRGGAFSESVTSHELGHQWWGDNITCNTWSDIWLNEGFATYTEALWEERKPNPTTTLQAAMSARKPSASGIASAGSYVYIPASETSNANRIFSSDFSYRKGGWVLHMLRKIMGDTAFFNGLQTYRATYQLGAASTSDFTTVMTGVYGQDLSWFFNPWLYLPGAPTYSFGWANTIINGQTYLRLNVSQTQNAPAPLFTMPMDVQITTASGVINTSIRTHSASDDFLIPIPAAASAILLDPNGWILNYGKDSVSYVQGPPKIVSVSPLPGASIAAAAAPSTLSIVFSDNVNIAPANIGITLGATNIPFTLGYNPATFTATLSFSGPLAPGNYSIAISDAIAAAANAQHLDGELATNTPASLPSGDGVAEGPALFSFTITAPPCAPDFDQNSVVNVQDIFAFLSAWFAGAPAADFNHANGIGVQDIFDFLAAWFVGC